MAADRRRKTVALTTGNLYWLRQRGSTCQSSALRYPKEHCYFTFMWPCIVINFFVIKPTRYTTFTNLFCHETLHISDSSSVHHQEFIHCTLSNGMCHTVRGPDRKLSTNLYDTYHCWVYSELTPDDGQKNCPKHVEFHDKTNLWN